MSAVAIVRRLSMHSLPAAWGVLHDDSIAAFCTNEDGAQLVADALACWDIRSDAQVFNAGRLQILTPAWVVQGVDVTAYCICARLADKVADALDVHRFLKEGDRA